MTSHITTTDILAVPRKGKAERRFATRCHENRRTKQAVYVKLEGPKQPTKRNAPRLSDEIAYEDHANGSTEPTKPTTFENVVDRDLLRDGVYSTETPKGAPWTLGQYVAALAAEKDLPVVDRDRMSADAWRLRVARR